MIFVLGGLSDSVEVEFFLVPSFKIFMEDLLAPA